MNCKEVQANLSFYLDQELSVDEMNQIKTHLDYCSACREELASLQETVSLLSSLDEIIPPASFRQELFAKLEKTATQGVRVEQKEKSLCRYGGLRDRFRALRQNTVFWPVAITMVLLILISPALLDGIRMGGSKSADSSLIAEEFDYGQGMMSNQARTDESLNSMEMQSATNGMAPKLMVTSDNNARRKADGASTPQLMMDMKEAGEPLVAAQNEVESNTVTARKLIKNAEMYLQVDDYDQALNTLKENVITLGGYITNETANAVDSRGTKRGNLQIRIPQYRFDEFLIGMDDFGKLKNSYIYSQDVTEEYIDVGSRLKTMRTKEERLLNILTQSGNLSDVLDVENELANTRAQLESLEGRMRYLNNQTEYSTVNISLEQVVASTQQVSASGLEGLGVRVKEAFIKAINNIFLGLGISIVFISAAIPYLVVAGILFVIVWGIWRGLKQKRK